jgi:hypothetical protein
MEIVSKFWIILGTSVDFFWFRCISMLKISIFIDAQRNIFNFQKTDNDNRILKLEVDINRTLINEVI